uniref:FCH and mu domain containing endocytic adaptor 1 n=1 Tax=Astyanax mexicanus TaxID=7994 RepID=A0A8B9K3R6_ASTMX
MAQSTTFAPMWDVFRVSSDKLALCHLELMRKMNDLIRDINKYGDEQAKVHRKTKEEVMGTLEAVQTLQVQNGHLQKSREGYHAKCTELERLRKEGAPQKELEKAELKSKKAAESFASSIEKFNCAGGDFEQKMSESAQKFQDIEEAHLRQMKQLIKGYSHSIEDTHVQVGQVHEEFKQNVENIGIGSLIQKFTEQKGTGKDRPGTVAHKQWNILHCIISMLLLLSFKNSPLEVDDEGFVIRAAVNQNDILQITQLCKENNFYSSDSDFDDEEPKKFHIQIRPVASSTRSNSAANELELKATVGALTLPPNRGAREGAGVNMNRERKRDHSVPPPDSSSSDDPFAITMIGSPTHQSALAAAQVATGPTRTTVVSPKPAPTPAQPKKELVHWSSLHNPFSEGVPTGGVSAGTVFNLVSYFFHVSLCPCVRCAGLSRGPSPISLSTQEAWPVAAAITEYINAYFKGGEHNRCLVKITGDLTMSFPAGITRIFTANPNAPVLSFRLVNISRVDHFLPNQKLLFSDPSQNDPDSRDFWFNMQALTFHLQREAELNPQASYYNVGLLKYQVSSQDPARAPLLLSAECQRSGTVTRVSLDYHCCPATAPATQLTAVQVLLPLDHTATDLQCQPPASWNAEERRLLWKLPNLSPTNHSKGSGTLCASWQCLEVPRGPPPSLAVQFVGSGASLSGMDVELVGSRYRMSLVKKRFATGKYMAGCSL